MGLGFRVWDLGFKLLKGGFRGDNLWEHCTAYDWGYQETTAHVASAGMVVLGPGGPIQDRAQLILVLESRPAVPKPLSRKPLNDKPSNPKPLNLENPKPSIPQPLNSKTQALNPQPRKSPLPPLALP